MDLWWLVVPSAHCSYDELKRRGCIALGWPEIGDLSRYLKDKPGWERQFKTFVQLRGNLAYQGQRHWTEDARSLDGVPALFWRLLGIDEGDYIVLMEAGSQLSLGRTEVRGFARIHRDALASYRYEADYHHAHQVCGGLQWLDWDLAHFGELPRPEQSFRALVCDNTALETVERAWQARQG